MRAVRSPSFAAPADGSSCAARPAASSVLRRLRAPPGGDRRDDRSARDVTDGRRARALPAAPLLAHAAPRPRACAARSQTPTSSRHRRLSARASSRSPGVTGKLVVDALAELRPGMPSAWTPVRRRGRRASSRRRARRGDRVAHGRCRRRRPRCARSCWRRSREDRGGRSRSRASRRSAPAGRRARSRGPRRSTSCEDALAGQREREPRASRRSGSARTCSSPTTASTGSSLKLAGELAHGRGRGRAPASPAAERRTRSACTARARPASAASSSPARSRAPPAAACG